MCVTWHPCSRQGIAVCCCASEDLSGARDKHKLFPLYLSSRPSLAGRSYRRKKATHNHNTSGVDRGIILPLGCGSNIGIHMGAWSNAVRHARMRPRHISQRHATMTQVATIKAYGSPPTVNWSWKAHRLSVCWLWAPESGGRSEPPLSRSSVEALGLVLEAVGAFLFFVAAIAFLSSCRKTEECSEWDKALIKASGSWFSIAPTAGAFLPRQDPLLLGSQNSRAGYLHCSRSQHQKVTITIFQSQSFIHIFTLVALLPLRGPNFILRSCSPMVCWQSCGGVVSVWLSSQSGIL
jgi:hypothetical protein